MIETLKKQWFVVLIAILFIAASLYFVIDQNKGKLPGKQADGKDVVFTIDGKDITADSFYDVLYSSMGISGVYQYFENAVVQASFTPTDDMKAEAKLQAESLVEQFKSQYGDAYEENLTLALNSVGLAKPSELNAFYVHYLSLAEIVKEYTNANMDTLYPTYSEAKKPRMVSHILIKMVDPDNPTAEETAKLNAAKEALAAGTDFKEVAKTYSDDSSSVDGGSLKFMDADTSYVPEFLEAALALEAGQTSEWIKVKKENYAGYHFIKVDSTDFESFKTEDGFFSSLNKYYPDLQGKAIWAQAQKLKIDFKGNTELEASLKAYMGITEDVAPQAGN